MTIFYAIVAKKPLINLGLMVGLLVTNIHKRC